MKLLSLMLYKWKEEQPTELMACMELSSFNFFQRAPIKEQVRFRSRLVAGKTPLGKRSVIELEKELGEAKANVWVHPQGVAAVVLVDNEYPMRVSFSLLSEAVRIFLERMQGKWEDTSSDQQFSVPEIEDLFQKFQNPAEADKLTKVESDLEEVKGLVMQSLDDLLKRGESLDQLMAKSKDLSNTSVQFYRTAKKNNQCCKMY
mmetsp:Transcript_57583/g.122465  ORF Transcript_57583/g.122465 Transcript_57583/m.122465 type:complete len:203 (-) Transcript_57583:79-687(-)